ncbi:MAG: hypothetical protein M3Y71_14235 [Actinomycetota bacterium]|nr:hypothetical protein [Actinomycetota bacterium]
MTTKSQTASPSSTFGLPSFEGTTESMKNLNDKWMEASKNAGLLALDAYEKAVTSFVEFEKKSASDSHLPGMSALATAHTKAITDLTSSYTTAVRDLLK